MQNAAEGGKKCELHLQIFLQILIKESTLHATSKQHFMRNLILACFEI